MSGCDTRVVTLLLTITLAACSGGGSDGGAGPTRALNVTLRNNHTLEIQIAAPNETFSDGTRLAPGASRVASVPDAQVGGNVAFRVGRNNQQVAAQSCPMARDTRNPEVHWDGTTLACVNW